MTDFTDDSGHQYYTSSIIKTQTMTQTTKEPKVDITSELLQFVVQDLAE